MLYEMLKWVKTARHIEMGLTAMVAGPAQLGSPASMKLTSRSKLIRQS
jgi:hypothetical protein